MNFNSEQMVRYNNGPLEYPQTFSPTFGLSILYRAFRAKDRVEKLSWLNCLKDYSRLSGSPELYELHKLLNQELIACSENWEAYDYGGKHFYQSYKAIGITGLRDTEARIAAYGLSNYIKGKSVLEIGSNTGFLTCQLAEFASSITAVELNPFLVNISRLTADWLRIKNCTFHDQSFETFDKSAKFGVVLAFANHITIDDQSAYSLDEYFHNCRRLVADDGLLLFESHPKGFEQQGLEMTKKHLCSHFDIAKDIALSFGTNLDQERNFVVATPKN